MTQNTSHAVMAQRHEAHDSLDHFPTPAWATRALCEWLKERSAIAEMTCWEPACAEGHMARPLAEYFRSVRASDVHDYGFGEVKDFLFPPHDVAADWIVTNPPFRVGDQFAATSLLLARRGVAMLVRTAFLESADRYRFLFVDTPPTDILQFVERVPMFKGRINRKGSTATAYCWLVWNRAHMVASGAHRTEFHWLAPCRKRLERDSDYAGEAT